MSTLYTIGYATKPIEVFIAQLQQYGVDVVADIRSVPYSKVFHDYHQENIQRHLAAHKIRYVYLGNELGPRSKNDAHYDQSGQVQFDRLMQSELFYDGINRLNKGLQKNYTIVLMCAEKDPATCHRSLLVSHYLTHHAPENTPISEITINHIKHDGQLETQQSLEQRLATMHKLDSDLFMSQREREQQAYEIQLKNTSYRKDSSTT